MMRYQIFIKQILENKIRFTLLFLHPKSRGLSPRLFAVRNSPLCGGAAARLTAEPVTATADAVRPEPGLTNALRNTINISMKISRAVGRLVVFVLLAVATAGFACIFSSCNLLESVFPGQEGVDSRSDGGHDYAALLGGWMGMIDDDALVTEIVMPGSHDSGTYGMLFLGETQSLSFGDQMRSEARYFDVRIRRTGEGELRFYHSILTSENGYGDFLSDAVRFLEENPTEFLILDYQHRDPAGDRESDNTLFSMLLDALGEERILCAPDGMSDLDYVDSLTLGEARGKVLVTFGADARSTDYDFVMVRDSDGGTRAGSVLHSPYDERNDVQSEEYVNRVFGEYIAQYSAYDGGICVLQTQLLAGNDNGFVPQSMEEVHNPNVTAWIKSCKDDPDLLAALNVIMRDYLTPRKCIDIIELNKYKNFVAEEHASAFDALVAADDDMADAIVTDGDL